MSDLVQASTVFDIVIGFIAFIISLLKLPKYELNVWQIIASGLGKAFNQSINIELENIKVYFDDKLETKLSELEIRLLESDNDRTATNARYRIILFNDEIIRGVKHSKQHFDLIIKEIDYYENHCRVYPNFENGVCDKACENIHRIYNATLKTNGFLSS